MEKIRCGWVPEKDYYIKYHDTQWGVPVHRDRKLFEMLILEGMQAGLSWDTILKKRKNFQKAFDNFDYEKVAKYDQNKFDELMQDAGIIRNKLKIKSAIQNARSFIQIRNEYGTFNKYIWSFVNNKPVVNKPKNWKEIPAKTKLSDTISKELKKKGMNFVGSTIIYAYMQSIGMVDDHEQNCFKKKIS